jgi:hypothetical protein
MVKPPLSKGTSPGSAAPECGPFVWTDTWVRRNGKWQIVAAEHLIVPEALHAHLRSPEGTAY